MQRRRRYGSATLSTRRAVCKPGLAADALQRLLKGQAVHDGGEHAHVVGGGFLDDFAAGRELGAAEDIAAADDDGQLHAALPDALDLPSDAERLLDRDAAFARRAEALAGEFEDDTAIFGRERIATGWVGHDMSRKRLADDDTEGADDGPSGETQQPRPSGRGCGKFKLGEDYFARRRLRIQLPTNERAGREAEDRRRLGNGSKAHHDPGAARVRNDRSRGEATKVGRHHIERGRSEIGHRKPVRDRVLVIRRTTQIQSAIVDQA